jgi:hypothetical protein
MSMAQQINLYDSALQKQRDWLSLANVTAAGVLLLLAIAVLGAMTRHEVPSLIAQTAAGDTQLKTLRDQLAALSQQVASRKPDVRLEQELGTAQLVLSLRKEVLAVLQQRLGPDSASFAEYLRGFGRQSMSGLWLTAFNFDAASSSIEIHGRTIDPALVPEYIRRLGKEPAFQGRSFAALKLVEGKLDRVPNLSSTRPVTNAQPSSTNLHPAADAVLAAANKGMPAGALLSTASGLLHSQSAPSTQPTPLVRQHERIPENQKAPFHEFVLIPVQSVEVDATGKAVMSAGGER